MKYLIAGLGNIGPEYKNTRHNIGFQILDALAGASNISFSDKRYGFIAEYKYKARTFILLKPTTYMNLSGQAVGDLLRFYKVSPNQVYVIHDDLDLEPGQIKVKIGGGHGGHNGLKSLDQHITQDYWRVRMGIGHPGRSPGQEDRVAHYVLSNFSKTDEDWVTRLLSAICDEVVSLFGSEPGIWLTKIAENLRR